MRHYRTKRGTSGAFAIHPDIIDKENKIIFEKKIYTKVDGYSCKSKIEGPGWVPSGRLALLPVVPDLSAENRGY